MVPFWVPDAQCTWSMGDGSEPERAGTREGGRNQMTGGFTDLANQSGVYPESLGEAGKDFKQASAVVRFSS